MTIATVAGSLCSESAQETGWGRRPFRGFPLIIDVGAVLLALLLLRLGKQARDSETRERPRRSEQGKIFPITLFCLSDRQTKMARVRSSLRLAVAFV